VPRVVADTNIYISAFNFGGQASRVLELAQEEALELVVSPAILQEIQGVLIKKFKWSTGQALAAISNILRFCEMVEPSKFLDVVKADHADNRILECALAGRAEAIISGDKQLLKLGEWEGIVILDLRQFLETFTKI